jgi:hypothetical protein
MNLANKSHQVFEKGVDIACALSILTGSTQGIREELIEVLVNCC